MKVTKKWEMRTDTYALPYVKEMTNRNLLYDAGSLNPVLCDDLEGWDWVRSRRQVQEGEDVCVPMADSGIWQKLTEYCKAIILQLKINNFF